MKFLMSARNLPFLLVACLFTFIPTRQSVEILLTQLVVNYQLAPFWQWGILLFSAFIPCGVLLVPWLRSLQSAKACPQPKFRYLQVGSIFTFGLCLAIFCTFRLLYWLGA